MTYRDPHTRPTDAQPGRAAETQLGHAAETLLRAEGITFGYAEGDEVLRGASLQVEAGSIVAIMGGNGSGKSTLAKICCGLFTPRDGSVQLLGRTIDADTELRFIAGNIGMVLQNPEEQLVSNTVEADVAFGPCNLGLDAGEVRARVAEALAAVGLSDLAAAETSTLSGGQKQKLAIAGTLALHPRVLILDEATSMLDPVSTSQIHRIIRDLTSQGMGIVLITHDLDEAALADRVVVLHEGRVLAEGTPAAVLADTALLQEARLLAPALAPVLATVSPDSPASPDSPGSLHPSQSAATRANDERALSVQFKGVSFSYETSSDAVGPTLRNADLDVPAGSIIGIAGASGSGKSTLLRHVNALLQPSMGTVRTLGLDTADRRNLKAIRQGAAFAMQHPQRQLFAKTVRDDIAFGPKNLGWPTAKIERAVAEAMAQAGLDESVADRNPFHLSGGYQRRAAIAGVLAMQPKVLVLDEPMAGLDPMSRGELGALLLDLARRGTTIMLSSHDLRDLATLCDRVAILKDGRIVAQGSTDDILAETHVLLNAGLLAR